MPRWLQASDFDPRERGNRRVFEMAQTFGARKITLLTFWDGKGTGDGRGGIADTVRIAEKTGVINVRVIDAGQLLRRSAISVTQLKPDSEDAKPASSL